MAKDVKVKAHTRGKSKVGFSFRYWKEENKNPIDVVIYARNFKDAKKIFVEKTGESVFSALDEYGRSYTEEGRDWSFG